MNSKCDLKERFPVSTLAPSLVIDFLSPSAPLLPVVIPCLPLPSSPPAAVPKLASTSSLGLVAAVSSAHADPLSSSASPPPPPPPLIPCLTEPRVFPGPPIDCSSGPSSAFASSVSPSSSGSASSASISVAEPQSQIQNSASDLDDSPTDAQVIVDGDADVQDETVVGTSDSPCTDHPQHPAETHVC